MKTDGSVITVTTYKAGPFSLLLGEYDRRLCLCSWIGGKAHAATIKRVCSHLGADLCEGCTPQLDLAARELDEYFSGAAATSTCRSCCAAQSFSDVCGML